MVCILAPNNLAKKSFFRWRNHHSRTVTDQPGGQHHRLLDYGSGRWPLKRCARLCHTVIPSAMGMLAASILTDRGVKRVKITHLIAFRFGIVSVMGKRSKAA